MSTTILPTRGLNFPDIQALPRINPSGGLAGSSGPSSFSDLISTSIGTVEQAYQDATSKAQQFLAGENEDLHTVAIAEQKAEITSELFLQVRSKAISAYQEIMKMQL